MNLEKPPKGSSLRTTGDNPLSQSLKILWRMWVLVFEIVSVVPQWGGFYFPQILILQVRIRAPPS